jgi:outer membrane protein TolC
VPTSRPSVSGMLARYLGCRLRRRSGLGVTGFGAEEGITGLVDGFLPPHFIFTLRLSTVPKVTSSNYNDVLFFQGCALPGLHLCSSIWRCRFCIAMRGKGIEAKGLAVNTKGVPADVVRDGTFSRSGMFRLPTGLRYLSIIVLLNPLAVPWLGAQSSGPSPSISLPGSQSPFTGSDPEQKATPEVLQLDFSGAIERGLRHNLGLLISGDQTIAARGEKWKQLSDLLPNLSARLEENVQTQSLTALGLKSNVFPFPLPRVIGPFNYLDMRASLSQSLFNFKDIEQVRAAGESLKSAQFSYKDARELVVLAVGNSYLQAIAGAARAETAEAQVTNAQALYDKAIDQQKAGLSPAIDTLRSQVELQTRQQQLISARNDFAKQKLSLARVIGLAPGQEFALTEKAPYQTLTPQPLELYLQRAYASRPDYQAAQAQVRAAELSRRAASAGHYPTLDVDANYGDIGVTPAQSNGTWQVAGSLNIPIFAGGKVHSDVLNADAQLKQARSQLGDLRGRIDYEVRASLLDLNAAAEQVEVARSSVELAEEALTQSRDRFSAGVADNLEVVQAQESVAAAHESYIQSLYAHNLAKVELARAIGDAEEGVKRFLKGDR